MYTYLQRIGRFELISFGSGFALLTFELLATRLLAPTIGSSIYVWTSVIGVIIAALSLGYAVGGRLADRRVRSTDVIWLLLLSSLTVLVMTFVATDFLKWVASAFYDSRIQGVIISLLLFAPTSFLLGVVSPYLVRLRVSSARTSGESVALLSALNSIGGITGTFLTGFIFFSYVGVAQALVIVALILLSASWLVEPRARFVQRALISGLLMVLGFLALTPASRPGLIASIDTPSATYQIQEGTLYNDSVRVLVSGPEGFQSGRFQDGRKDLAFFYTQKMADIVAQAPHKRRILILGGGAFTLPQYLAEKYPASQIDTVEIDPELPMIARRYFGYQDPPNVRVVSQDARAFLNTNTAEYDIILVDAYNDGSIPFALATREYAAVLRRALVPQGVVVANMVAGSNDRCRPLLEKLHAVYRSVLSESRLFPNPFSPDSGRQNIVAVYSNDNLRWVSEKGAKKVTIASVPPPTDNFAPLERLIKKCH